MLFRSNLIPQKGTTSPVILQRGNNSNSWVSGSVIHEGKGERANANFEGSDFDSTIFKKLSLEDAIYQERKKIDLSTLSAEKLLDPNKLSPLNIQPILPPPPPLRWHSEWEEDATL